MRGGRRIGCGESILAIRQRVVAELGRLPARLRGLAPAEPYPVYLSERLHADCREAGVFSGGRNPEPPVPVRPVADSQGLAFGD
jgi:hypothetical protein